MVPRVSRYTEIHEGGRRRTNETYLERRIQRARERHQRGVGEVWSMSVALMCWRGDGGHEEEEKIHLFESS